MMQNNTISNDHYETMMMVSIQPDRDSNPVPPSYEYTAKANLSHH